MNVNKKSKRMSHDLGIMTLEYVKSIDRISYLKNI